MLRNQDIRQSAKNAGVRLWQVGEQLHMSDANFSRFLRKELESGTKARILAIIEELREEDEYGEHASDNESQRCCGISRM